MREDSEAKKTRLEERVRNPKSVEDVVEVEAQLVELSRRM